MKARLVSYEFHKLDQDFLQDCELIKSEDKTKVI